MDKYVKERGNGLKTLKKSADNSNTKQVVEWNLQSNWNIGWLKNTWQRNQLERKVLERNQSDGAEPCKMEDVGRIPMLTRGKKKEQKGSN